MLLGVIADDFTGASDIANTIAKGIEGQGGLRAVQYLGIPRDDAASDVEAGVISLKSRSIPSGDAVAQSREAMAWLLRQGCRQIVFKYCSTFDSTAEGNIGPVAEALAADLGETAVVVCPAFPQTGRTVYQGHLFVGDRPLDESGMERHPLNPMTDPDIRRWLQRQAKGKVGHIGLDAVRRGTQEISRRREDISSRGEILAVVDAVADEDLLEISRACAASRLITGASGIALGLPRNFIEQGLALGSAAAIPPIGGPEAILAGSCSGTTREQVRRHAASHPAFEISVDEAMKGVTGPADLVQFILDRQGKAPLVYSSSDPDDVGSVQARYGRAEIAAVLEALFAETARLLVASGIRRLVVAGGETSGAVVSALDLKALDIGPEIDPGVPVLRGSGDDPVGLALKSGNFGSADFFIKALERMAGR